MAEKITYVSLQNLSKYNELLLGKMDVELKKSIKNIVVQDDTILCYKSEIVPSVEVEGVQKYDASKADFSIGISSSDVEKLKLDLGNIEALTTDVKTSVVLAINSLKGEVDDNTDAIETLNGDDETEGSVAKAIKDLDDTLADIAKSGKADDVTIEDTENVIEATNVEGALTEIAKNIDDVEEVIGDVEEGKTVAELIADAQKAADDAQDDVDALEELVGTGYGKVDPEDADSADHTVKSYIDAKVSDAGSAGVVTVKEISTGLADSVLKSYEFYQGGETADKKIATINLAKDLVTTGGEVVTLADGDVEGVAAGTYLKLTIANQTAPVYINVKDLVDLYTGETAADGVITVTVDASTNKITATIADASIARAKIDAAFEKNIADLETDVAANKEAIGTESTDTEEATGIYKRIEDLENSTDLEDAISNLDSKISTVTETEADPVLNISIEQEDGVLKSISANVKAETFDEFGAADAVLGESTDDKDKTTVYGVKAYANDLFGSMTAASDEDIAKLFAPATTEP